MLSALGRQLLETMPDPTDGNGERTLSRTASAARRLAAEIVPKFKNDSAANLMEFVTALNAVMAEGIGPVNGHCQTALHYYSCFDGVRTCPDIGDSADRHWLKISRP